MYDSRDPWGAATEAEWPNTDDPAQLLEAMRGRTGDRKPRLAACAFCRRAADSLSEPERIGMDVAERYADGMAVDDERQNCLISLLESVGGIVHSEDRSHLWAVVETCGIPNAAIAALLNDTEMLVDGHTGRCIRGTSGEGMAYRAIFSARLSVEHTVRHMSPVVAVQEGWLGRVWRAAGRLAFRRDQSRNEPLARELSHQADLVRDIFGNPFRPVACTPEWRTDTAIALARTMYESREFGAMPILADALQDAGCDNDDVLNHCRVGGPHVRGCWVCDLVLGKV